MNVKKQNVLTLHKTCLQSFFLRIDGLGEIKSLPRRQGRSESRNTSPQTQNFRYLLCATVVK